MLKPWAQSLCYHPRPTHVLGGGMVSRLSTLNSMIRYMFPFRTRLVPILIFQSARFSIYSLGLQVDLLVRRSSRPRVRVDLV